MAVGADSLADPRYLRAVLDIVVRALPHGFRDVPGTAGQTLALDIDGRSGGQWTLSYDQGRWTLWRGVLPSASARVRLSDDTAWQLLFNALGAGDAETAIEIEGDPDLARAFFRTRSVIV